jgi:hypothetical protein
MERNDMIEQNGKMVDVEEAVETVDSTVKLKLELVRTKSKDGNVYSNYFVRGVMRDKEIRAEFRPRKGDVRAYDFLNDVIFAGGNVADLRVTEGVMRQDDGTKMRYSTYEAIAVGDDGIEYSMKVSPLNESDKAIAKVFVQQVKNNRAF